MPGEQQTQPDKAVYVPSKILDTPYPLIDNDPHIRRVYSYSRTEDWLLGAAMAVGSPVLMWLMQRVHPARAGKGAFASGMRLATALGVTAGLVAVAQQSSYRFYGFKENKREQERDMREMVDKIKRGEPLYGKSKLTPDAQAMAHRNSRYTATFLHVVPWANIVNHEHHGVDTAKYYQQAERELEAERNSAS